MRKLLLIILLCIIYNQSFASEKQWKAKWIWADENLKSEAILARKVFELKNVPVSSILKITASDFYQLYINGKYINRGPARSAAHHQSFDCIDVSSYLKEGENLIAVRAVFEPGAKSYQFDARAGLLIQMELDEQLIVSDDSWRLMEDASWDKDSPSISRFQRDVCDRVDMRHYEQHWFSLAYDDSKWPMATELIRNEGWPAHQRGVKPSTFINPWTNLVQRDIPMLQETIVVADKLILVKGYQDEHKELVAEKIALTGETDKHLKKSIGRQEAIELRFNDNEKGRLLVFDFGEIINGFPKLDIQGTVGTQVSVLCAPYVLNNQFCATLVDAKSEDRITLSGERDLWEASYFKPCRYMAVWIENKGKPVKISSIALRGLSYPYELKGQMESKDSPWVNAYFEASAKTIDVCTTDAITDNYRERRQYAQTGYYGALGNYYTFGDMALQRRYLIQIAQEQMADGIMPAYAPIATTDYMVILDSNCFWLKSFWNYYLYSGDTETVKQLLPTAERLLELLDGFTNENGLIDNPPYAYWLDHAMNDRSGANFTLNTHYLEALENYADILDWLDKGESEVYIERALSIRNSLQQQFWNDSLGLFVDALVGGKQSEKISEHANAMALALNIASKEQGDRIAQSILEDDNNNFIMRASGMTMLTPAMSYYLHKGLCEYGYVKESFDLFKTRFGHMIENNTNQTLWEEWWRHGTGRTGKFMANKTRSDAQTESAFPPALFAEYLFGLKPVEPGLRKWTLKYFNSGVKNLEGIIPVGDEKMHIEWYNGKKKKLSLIVPIGVSIDLDISSLNAKGKVLLNKQEISSEKIILSLTEGEYTITF